MSKKILNLHEEATNQRLVEGCSTYGASAYPKVRLADVLPIENSGITNAEYSYAMKAHFDFVVCDKEKIPQFAVEFDGPLHRNSDQQERDKKKNGLCKYFGFPLLRINSNHLPKKYKEYDLLSWCVENWFLSIEFKKAQEDGHVPWDEPYDPMMFINLPGRKSKFPMRLASEVRLKIQKLAKQGKIVSPFISDWIGIDKNGDYHGIAWVRISEGLGVATETAMRKQQFPVSETELLSEILCFQIIEAVEGVLEGHRKPEEYSSIMNRLENCAETFKVRSFAGYGNENPREKQP